MREHGNAEVWEYESMDAGLGVRNTQLWACGKAEHTDEIRENMSTQKQAHIHWKMGRNYSKRILNYIFYKWFCFANMRRHKRGHMPRQKRDWYISTRTGHLHYTGQGRRKIWARRQTKGAGTQPV